MRRETEAAKNSVGLIFDGNLLREAMIRRIGLVPEEWRRPFAAVTAQSADILYPSRAWVGSVVFRRLPGRLPTLMPIRINRSHVAGRIQLSDMLFR